MWPDSSGTKPSWWLVSHSSCQDMFFLWTVSSLLLASAPTHFKNAFLFSSACPCFHCFFFSSFCLHSLVGKRKVGESQTQERGCSLLFFSLLPSPTFFPSLLKCRQAVIIMLLVSKLVSVLGVPGEQPRYNSRVKWASKGGKMNSMLWGFPNPNSWQGLSRLLLVFTSVNASSMWWRTKVENCFVIWDFLTRALQLVTL